jgi:PKD repeat protein
VGLAAVAGWAGDTGAAGVSLVAPDFTVGVTSSPLTTVQGRAAASTVTTGVSGGFNASINLSATGLPAGANATLAPAAMPAPGAGSATLTLAAGVATPPGSYTVTVTGAGGALNRSTTVTFVVTATTVQIYSDGFEGALTPNWELWRRPGAADANWGKSSYRKAAGGSSAYCAGSGSAAPPAGGPYPANMEGWMTYGPFSLLDATGALVTFKYWMNNHDANDKLRYFVSLNNSSFSGNETATPSLTWQTVTLDLGDPHLGLHPLGQSQVWFALVFVSDGSGQSEGAYVDSVTISKTVAAPACAVTCAATVPSQGAPGSPVQLAGTLGAGNCVGLPAFSWDFGDATPGSAQAAPAHTYQSPGSYPWHMAATMGGQACNRSGTVTVTAPPECSLSCSATVPAAGSRSAAVSFHGEATATDCGAPPAYAWDFGDGSHAATADAQHAYTSRGSYPWTLTVTSGATTCSKAGTLAIGQAVRRHLSGSH